jgi:hypothetical protein
MIRLEQRGAVAFTCMGIAVNAAYALHHHTITPSQHHTDLLRPVEQPPGFMV